MSYNPSIPLSSDIPAQSQAQIKDNFTALDPIYNGINSFIILPEHATGPATAVNQMALFTKAVGGVSAMFIRPENQAVGGTAIDFTTAILGARGQCTLPCGLYIKWGLNSVSGGSTTENVTFAAAGLTNFSTTCFAVFLTPNTLTGSIEDYILCVTAKGTAGFTAQRGNTYKGTTAGFYWIAIGK